jgi:hypothetical protein
MIPLPSLSSSLSPLREALNAAPPEARLNWMRGLGRKELSALWDLSPDGGVVTLDYLVGPQGETVIHHGHNSLPAFNSFEKRFCRREELVQGYNHNSALVTFFSGPGHFTCRQEGSEVAIDYTIMPPSVPPDFPALVDNDGGTRQLVYGQMIDRLRRVSRVVTIGKAWRKGEPYPAWFMLIRDCDPPADV